MPTQRVRRWSGAAGPAVFSLIVLTALPLAGQDVASAEPPAEPLLASRWFDRRPDPPALAGLPSGWRPIAQLESGYTYTLDQLAGSELEEHVYPDLLLRWAVTDRMELRVGWPGVISREVAGLGDETESLNPTVGFLLDLYPQQGAWPQLAVAASAPIDLEGSPFAADSIQPLGEVLYGWYLSDRAGLWGNTGFALFDVDGDRFIQLQQALTLDYVLTDSVSTFVQWEMLLNHASANDGPQHMLTGGFNFFVNERIQIGIRSGVGLNERAPDFLSGIRTAIGF